MRRPAAWIDTPFFSRSRAQVVETLKEKQAKITAEGAQTNFNQILMKFPKIHRQMENLEKIFKEVDKDGDGYLDLQELTAMMGRLGSPMRVTEAGSKEHASCIETRCDPRAPHVRVGI